MAVLAVTTLLMAAVGCTPGTATPTLAPPDSSSTSAATSVAQSANASAVTKGFVTRAGVQLKVNGSPWRFAGYNLPCANPFVMSAGELGHYLDIIQQNSGATVIRAWFFQTNGGPGNWAPFDRVLNALKARGMRVVPSLTNEWNGGCDAGAGAEKTVDWYQGGYRQSDAGHALPFRNFAIQVASHYANNPTIAMWQLVNEAQTNTKDPSGQLRCDNIAGQLALRAFSDDMAGAIKAVDKHHLVNLGVLGGSQCGIVGSAAYQYVHDGLVDLCEYHDYGASAAAMPPGPDFLAQRIHDCATLPHGPKPLFIGEAGIQGNVQPDGGPPACNPWPGCSPFPVTSDTLTRRATFFEAKMKAAFKAGVVGYVLWVKSPYYSPTSDVFAIGDNDPTENAMMSVVGPATP